MLLLKDKELEDERVARAVIGESIKRHLVQRSIAFVNATIPRVSSKVLREMKVMFRSTLSPEVRPEKYWIRHR
jgi:hypothetical protein